MDRITVDVRANFGPLLGQPLEMEGQHLTPRTIHRIAWSYTGAFGTFSRLFHTTSFVCHRIERLKYSRLLKGLDIVDAPPVLRNAEMTTDRRIIGSEFVRQQLSSAPMFQPLLSQLQNPNPAQRKQAITALGLIRHPKARQALRFVYFHDPDQTVRDAALQYLPGIRAKLGLPPASPNAPSPDPRRVIWDCVFCGTRDITPRGTSDFSGVEKRAMRSARSTST